MISLEGSNLCKWLPLICLCSAGASPSSICIWQHTCILLLQGCAEQLSAKVGASDTLHQRSSSADAFSRQGIILLHATGPRARPGVLCAAQDLPAQTALLPQPAVQGNAVTTASSPISGLISVNMLGPALQEKPAQTVLLARQSVLTYVDLTSLLLSICWIPPSKMHRHSCPTVHRMSTRIFQTHMVQQGSSLCTEAVSFSCWSWRSPGSQRSSDFQVQVHKQIHWFPADQTLVAHQPCSLPSIAPGHADSAHMQARM